jgi:hypothetical protein
MRAPAHAATIDELVGAELLPLGFKPIRPRRWVRTARSHIRGIFEFQALRGGIYSGRWGVSLDFVPMLHGERLRWKRTATTADFDLCIDPIDEYGAPPDWCSFSRSTLPREGRMMALAVSAATQAAKLDFSRANSILDVVAMFGERAATRFQRFSLENYTQTHLAWGLSLIAVDDLTEGERHLELFCARFSIDPHDRMIRQAIFAAQNAATATKIDSAPPS